MPVGQQNVSPQVTAQQSNALARQIVLANAVNEWQQIYQSTLTGTIPGQIVNVPLRNVGLIKRLLVRVAAQFAQSAAETHTLQPLGTANLFSQVVLTDLSNQTRINTSGWHLQMVASAKRQWPFGSSTGTNAAAATDCPFGFGTNFQKLQTAPATVTTAAAQNVFAYFEVPVSYSDTDLRGAIYGNVVNATMNLALTVNPVLSQVTGSDPTFSVFQSSTAAQGTWTNFQITVYQNYLDQIPIGKQGPILPALDLSTAYLLNYTQAAGLVANSDNPFPYANFRDFLSTTVIYDNAGVLNTGSDINYFALQAANYTNLIKLDPYTTAFFGRVRQTIDFPKSCYYFDHRDKPISTVQYGNMSLVMNPLTVTNATSAAYLGYEALALINQVTQAGSLYGT